MQGDLVDVSDWDKVERSSGGRGGWWLRNLKDPMHPKALVKFPLRREGNSESFVTCDGWAEALASTIGQTIGLSVPDIEVVLFEDAVCPLSWDFCSPDYSLREGPDLTGDLRGGKYPRVPLERVRAALAPHIGPEVAKCLVVRMVCFDILIGNGDRHQGNWGALIPFDRALSPRMAPFYDHGSAFASTVGPLRLAEHLNDMDTFDRGFKYEILIDGVQGRPRLAQLLPALRAWDGNLAGFSEALSILTDDRIDDIVARTYAGVVSSDRMEFARLLLRRRRDYILEG